jgi:hypothetical protein
MGKSCVKYVVTLTEEERGALRKLVSAGRAAAGAAPFPAVRLTTSATYRPPRRSARRSKVHRDL